MNILLSRIYALLIGALAIIGLFVSGHLFQIMNTDIALDLLRVILTICLVYVGFIAKSEKMATAVLGSVGVLYIVMGIAGLFSSTLGGLLPAGLTGFDIAFHLITGVLAAGAAGLHRTHHSTRAAHA